MRRRDVLFREFDRWGFDRRGWRKETRRNYFARARRADAWLTEERRVSLVFATAKDIQFFMFEATPGVARTRNGYRQALIGFGDFLIDRGFRKDNPARQLDRLPTPRLLPKALPADAVMAIMATASVMGARDEAMVSTLGYCGLRHTELRTLEWPHIYSDRWVRFAGKGGDERAVPIPRNAWDALARWRVASNNPRWVFPSTRRPDRPMSSSWFLTRIREIGVEAGIVGLHPHLFRHSVATQLLDDGADIRDVQVFLGHACLSTTQIYTYIRPVRLEDAARRLDYAAAARRLSLPVVTP